MENKKLRRERQKNKRRRDTEEQYSKSVTDDRVTDTVTEDLVTDIISRLPAKDLMRFTCVSKSWCSSICTDTRFRRLQTERTASPHRPFLLIERVFPKIRRTRKRILYYNYLIDLHSIEGHSNHIREIHNPFDRNDRRRRDALVIGSCNGLILLRQQRRSLKPWPPVSDPTTKKPVIPKRRRLKMAVSNPATKEHVVIPPASEKVDFHGLGYDRVHDCYKVVAKVKRRLELMIYDLNKGTWGSFQFGAWWRRHYDELKADEYETWGTREEDDTLNSRWSEYSVECVDGDVYWCIHDSVPEMMVMMVCFLLEEEEFHVVKPPELGEVKYCPFTTVLDGRFVMMCSRIAYDRHELGSLWSLDMDCGDGTRQWRWTKLFEISDPCAMLPTSPYSGELHPIPLCFSEGPYSGELHPIPLLRPEKERVP